MADTAQIAALPFALHHEIQNSTSPLHYIMGCMGIASYSFLSLPLSMTPSPATPLPSPTFTHVL